MSDPVDELAARRAMKLGREDTANRLLGETLLLRHDGAKEVNLVFAAGTSRGQMRTIMVALIQHLDGEWE